MKEDRRNRSLARSMRMFQRSLERAGPAAAASYSLIGAILLFGAIGYGIDRWRGSAPWGLAGGLALGLVIGFYQLAKAVWKPR
ncbi:MAG: AtpZ/AtpI family protein [Acidobacteria bacterium]|nr:AtpZ/AtpI family protein [Acidobacteriota bacterium]